MPQIALFPLGEAELKAKELATKIRQHEELAEEEDTGSREDNEKLKVLVGEIRQLAKIIETEKEERQATEEEAPWQGLIDRAEEGARGRRRRTRRDVDGEVIEGEEDG
jgi:hypothetical protein